MPTFILLVLVNDSCEEWCLLSSESLSIHAHQLKVNSEGWETVFLYTVRKVCLVHGRFDFNSDFPCGDHEVRKIVCFYKERKKDRKRKRKKERQEEKKER